MNNSKLLENIDSVLDEIAFNYRIIYGLEDFVNEHRGQEKLNAISEKLPNVNVEDYLAIRKLVPNIIFREFLDERVTPNNLDYLPVKILGEEKFLIDLTDTEQKKVIESIKAELELNIDSLKNTFIDEYPHRKSVVITEFISSPLTLKVDDDGEIYVLF